MCVTCKEDSTKNRLCITVDRMSRSLYGSPRSLATETMTEITILNGGSRREARVTCARASVTPDPWRDGPVDRGGHAQRACNAHATRACHYVWRQGALALMDLTITR